MGYRELMNGAAATVSEEAMLLGAELVRDAQIVDMEQQAWDTYEQHVQNGECSTPEEVFGGDGGAEVRSFADHMREQGWPGAVGMNPVEQTEQTAPAPAPEEGRRRFLLTADEQPQDLRVSRWAAVTGRVRSDRLRPVAAPAEPTHGRAYGIGTTEIGDGGDGSHWTSARELPRIPVVVTRGDTVEIGVVRAAVNRRGDIVPDATDTPLPVAPNEQIRLGVYDRVISLRHLDDVEMPEEVAALLPEQPAGAIFRDADDQLLPTLITVSRRALENRAPSFAATLAATPAVSREVVAQATTFPNGGTTVEQRPAGSDVLDQTAAVAVEGDGTLVAVPAQRAGN